MGVEPFLVASSLLANMAQRLVRRLCEHCKQPYTPTEEDVLQLEVTTAFVASRGNTFYRPGGCEHCKQSGYRGRLGIYELLTVSQEVKQLVMRRTDAGAIKRQAVLEGMRTLRQDGADKVTRGLTSVEEILRVTQKEVA
jgi:general secretion pathway protein E